MAYQKFISKKKFIQNSLAAASVGGSFIILAKILEVPILPVTEIIIMKGLCSLTALLGIATEILLIFQKRLHGYQKGVYFNLLVASVLFSYGIAWHLNDPYFNYGKLLYFFPVIIITSVQGLIWARTDPIPDINNDSDTRGLYWLVPAVILGIIVFVITVLVSVRTVRFEDTFITFRYGWNLANGHGINWNLSDLIPSEGYTSFTFVILSAIFYSIKIDPLFGMIGLNLVSMGLLGYFVWQSGRMIYSDNKGLRSLLSVLILIIYPATGFHISTGMETIFYTMTLAGISWCALRWMNAVKNQTREIALLGIFILISGLTRPDGIVYGLLTLLILFILAPKKLLNKTNWMALAGTLLFPGIVYFAWRIYYFKLFFPLSFYHKVNVGGLYGEAARSVIFPDFYGLIILPFLFIIFFCIVLKKFPRNAFLILIPSLILSLFYSQVLAVAGLQYRFFYPYLPGFVILGAQEIAKVLTKTAQINRGVAAVVGIFILVFLSLAPFFYETRNNLNFFISGAQYKEEDDSYMQIGKALLNIDSSEAIGSGEAGKIGMLLRDYTVIDIVGLNDRYLALNPFSTEYLDQRGVNIFVTYPYPGELRGVFADVYRKVGEGFNNIEKSFLCIGNLNELDVFVRNSPISLPEKYTKVLSANKTFKAGICNSNTTARWAPQRMDLPLENWSLFDLSLVDPSTHKLQVTGEDPLLRSGNLNIEADRFNNVVITLQVPPPVDCPTLTLYFTRNDATDESEKRSIRINFTPSNSFQTIIANVRNHKEWNGIISHLRVDPVCGMNKGQEPILFVIKSILLN